MAYSIFVIVINKFCYGFSVQFRKQKMGHTENRIMLTNKLIEEIKFAEMQDFHFKICLDI